MYNLFLLNDHKDQATRVHNDVRAVTNTLRDITMIENFSTVVKDHSISAPVVATMLAVPGFVQIAQSFPQMELFNTIPEVTGSTRYIAGMESLTEAQGTSVSTLVSSLKTAITSFGRLLDNLDGTVGPLKAHVDHLAGSLSTCDLSPDIEAYVTVSLLSEEGLGKLFDMSEKYLTDIKTFSVDEFLAYPDKVKAEIDKLSDFVDDTGEALGLTLTEDGLKARDKGDDFVPQSQMLSEHGMDRVALGHFLDRSGVVLSALEALSAKKDDLVDGLTKSIDDIPSTLNGDEDTYGATDHITLTTCYITLTTKLIEESLLLVGRVVAAGQAIIDRCNESVDDMVVPTV